MAHLHKTKDFWDKISMVKVIIGDLLEDKVGRMRKERRSTLYVEGDIPLVNVGWKVRVLVAVICGGNHHSDECRQHDKVIRMPHHVANPYQ